ncbi:MAG: hypothetical protein L6Q57_04125 [Alphaproteobacteria bacterium]|nr:hypothetical protein [Alphaproteobacteria bacterium]MCK6440859.1 hypothetical protein [Planctomycetota bacterium]
MFTQRIKSQAKVVDGKLILSCTNALTPVVWQMDLAPAKASALEVQEQENGQARLLLRTQKNETVDIATFASKSEAIAMLQAVMRALEGAQGTTLRATSAGRAPRSNPRSSFWGGLAWLGSVLAAAFVLVIAIGLIGTQMLMPQGGLQSVEQTAIEPLAGTEGSGIYAPESQVAPSGEPVTAEQFLQGQ